MWSAAAAVAPAGAYMPQDTKQPALLAVCAVNTSRQRVFGSFSSPIDHSRAVSAAGCGCDGCGCCTAPASRGCPLRVCAEVAVARGEARLCRPADTQHRLTQAPDTCISPRSVLVSPAGPEPLHPALQGRVPAEAAARQRDEARQQGLAVLAGHRGDVRVPLRWPLPRC